MKVLAGRPEYRLADQAYFEILLRQCREHAWERRLRLLSYKTGEDWRGHCARVRETLRRAVGPFPERTPLNPRLVGTLERDGYRVEKLLLEGRPSYFVTANLYLPTKARFPAPAVVNPVGHWANSKAEALVQARGIGLARKGYVALIFDPVGQGERSQVFDERTQSYGTHPSTVEHSLLCAPTFLIGSTVINYMAWDGIRMLDYLATRPEVDATRIGCTGASGGGTYTMFLTALDERITAAVPVCSTAPYERMLANGQIGEPCQDPVGSYRDGLDMADLLMCAAPTAVQISCTTYDFFPLAGAREVYADVAAAYAAMGIPERANLIEAKAHHDYNREQREATYAWFNRWLGNESAGPEEPPFEPEDPQTLWCTSAGQVITDLGGETVLSLNRAQARRVIGPEPDLSTPASVRDCQERVRAGVAAVLGEKRRLPKPIAARPPAILEEQQIGDLRVRTAVFESETDLPIPGVVFAPATAGPHPPLLFLHDRGQRAESEPGGLIGRLARTGNLVYAVDLRGWGETAWWRRFPYDARDPEPRAALGTDSMLAYVGYLLGNWAITQRVADALAAIDHLLTWPEVDPARLRIVGRGMGGMVALHAAALDERIGGVALYEMLASYRAVIEADEFRHPVSGFPIGALRHYDLPDLVAALAPKPALVLNPRDALDEPLAIDIATAEYGRTARAYAALDGAPMFNLMVAMGRSKLERALEQWAGTTVR